MSTTTVICTTLDRNKIYYKTIVLISTQLTFSLSHFTIGASFFFSQAILVLIESNDRSRGLLPVPASG